MKSHLYLWDSRTLFIGTLENSIELSQGAASFIVSLAGNIQITHSQEKVSRSITSTLIPPDTKVQIDTQKQVFACLYLDPLLVDWNRLKETMSEEFGNILLNSKLELDFKRYLQQIVQKQLNYFQAYELLEKLLDTISGRSTSHVHPDHRVVKVIDMIKKSISDNLAVEQLAKAVNLSVPRLTQLFKENTGISIRKYRRWHRLFVSANQLSSGKSLTETAQDTGFSDSAHFSNTFRSIMGLKPSEMLSNPEVLTIHTLDFP
ncbi:helix-turn-helix domain-containing protein [Pleionea sediminis]|uniref:helix-turn-helix domain-containing protein n=1 Tax=Pleionea sediminis TaxID=2569479 RepID=UPI00118667D5|nr:AraC family transcriptional regulator [Pleionea sediminis]